MDTTEHTLLRGGVELYVSDRSGPASPILLLHGLAGSGTEMRETSDALAPHRVLRLDARGHGRSTRRPADVSRAEHVDDVVHVVETLVGAPVTLVGQSMGGHTAMLVAATRPDLVDRLVLLEAGVGGDGTEQSRAAMRDFFDSWPRPFRDLAHARSFLGSSAVGCAWANDLEERPDGLWPRFDTDVMIDTIAHVDAAPRWAEWSGVDLPTLVVFAKDGMFDQRARDLLMSGARSAQRVDLDRGTHDAHLDAFEPWIESLTAFLGASAH